VSAAVARDPGFKFGCVISLLRSATYAAGLRKKRDRQRFRVVFATVDRCFSCNVLGNKSERLQLRSLWRASRAAKHNLLQVR
jgi:hypothetical protein